MYRLATIDPVDDALERWLDDIEVPAYWRGLAPQLSIGGDSPAVRSVVHVDDALLTDLRSAMLTEGYFQFEPVLPGDVVNALATCVETLHRESIPLGFACVYDEFWHLNLWLEEVLVALLGTHCAQLPDLWAWYVAPGSRGWPPHREKGAESLLPSGYPKSLSVWVPLTDATPLNGCMYVVPADLDPDYNSDADPVVVHRLQDVRALPARAGSVLLWNQALLHWGGASSARAVGPRISFSIEYQRGDIAAFNAPLLPLRTAPAFQRRLGIVGKQILQYEHMVDAHAGIVELGKRLVERLASCFT